MIKVVIIDDEPKSIKILCTMLQEYCPEVSVVGKTCNAQEADVLIRQLQPDLVFLDIEMPVINGFELLEKFRPLTFEVIFVTAFNNYSLKAFRYNALDYLLKPVSIDELEEAVSRALQHIRLKQFNGHLDSFLQNLKKPATLKKIALPDKNSVVLVPISDIVRCEASRGYTYFVIKNKEKIISSRNIKEYEELLPEDAFFRVHNSHLINLNYIRLYHRGRGGQVEMEDGAVIEVAVRRKEDFLLRIGLKAE